MGDGPNLSVGLEGRDPNFGKIPDKLGLARKSPAGLALSLSGGVGDLPGGFVRYAHDWFDIRRGSEQVDAVSDLIELGVMTHLVRWGTEDTYSAGVDLMISWFRAEIERYSSITDPTFGVAAQLIAKLGCSNFGADTNWGRLCFDVNTSISAPYSMDNFDSGFTVGLSYEYGLLADIKTPRNHWWRSLAMGISTLVLDLPYLAVATFSNDIRADPDLRGQKIALDIGGGTALATIQANILDQTGDEIGYFIPPAVGTFFVGTVEGVLGSVEACGNDSRNGACTRTGFKNMALAPTVAIPKLLAEKNAAGEVEEPLWARFAVGGPIALLGLMVAYAEPDDLTASNIGLGIQNGATGGMFRFRF